MYTRYGLSSPYPLVKLTDGTKWCFQVVDCGAASAALKQERALAGEGELQKGSNMGVARWRRLIILLPRNGA